MKIIIGSIIVASLIGVMGLIESVDAYYMTVKTDQPTYHTSDTIFIRGTVIGHHLSTAITIKIESPDKRLVDVGQITNDNNLTYAETFVIGRLFRTNGTYALITTYGNISATTTFDVIVTTPPTPKTKLQIANENITNLETQIDKFETKKDKLKDLKDKWKEQFHVCKNDRKDLRIDNRSLKSKLNTTETQRLELEKLYTDLDIKYHKSQDTISGLYSQYYDLQSMYNSTLNELNQLKDRIQELESR